MISFLGVILLALAISNAAPLAAATSAAATSVAATSAAATSADTLFYRNYPYIRFVSENDSIGMSDEDFFDRSGRVVFPVNKYNLPVNDSLLAELAGKVIPQINKDSLQLLRLMLRGAASPEGPFQNNKRLGEHRAKALFDFLNSQLDKPLSEDVLNKRIDIEDYRSLCIMMRRASDPDYKEVEQLCDTYLPQGRYSQLKRQLQRLQGGRLWRRLLREYFPQLRASRLVLFFKELPPPPLMTGGDAQQTSSFAIKQIKQAKPALPPVVYPELVYRRELLSIKTNLLFYGIYMPGYNRWCPIPNVAVEYYPKRGHFTYGASLDCPWWVSYKNHKFFEIRNWQLETRYYLKSGNPKPVAAGQYPGAAFKGFYLQAYVHGGIFEIGFDADRGWKGEGIGAGVGAGYVMPISRKGHWRLEFAAQVGWFGCQYDPFQFENLINPNYHDGLYYYRWTQKASLFKRRQYRYNWIGPTRVGVTLSYDLLYRRAGKRWPGFRSYEIVWPNGTDNAGSTHGKSKKERRNAL